MRFCLAIIAICSMLVSAASENSARAAFLTTKQKDCVAPMTSCGTKGKKDCKTNLHTDVLNCGKCNNKCPTTEGAAVCTNGVCGYAAAGADCEKFECVEANSVSTNTLSVWNISVGSIWVNNIFVDDISVWRISVTNVSVSYVSATLVSAGTVSANEVSATQVNTPMVSAGTVNAENVFAGAVNANSANAATVNANAVNANTVSAGSVSVQGTDVIEACTPKFSSMEANGCGDFRTSGCLVGSFVASNAGSSTLFASWSGTNMDNAVAKMIGAQFFLKDSSGSEVFIAGGVKVVADPVSHATAPSKLFLVPTMPAGTYEVWVRMLPGFTDSDMSVESTVFAAVTAYGRAL